MFICLMIATAFPRLTRIFLAIVGWGLIFLAASFIDTLEHVKQPPTHQQ